MQIRFVSQPSKSDAVLAHVVLVREGGALSLQAQRLDEDTNGALSRAIRSGCFAGGAGETLDIVAPQGLEAAHILLVGVGAADPAPAEDIEVAAAWAYKALKTSGASELLLDFGVDAASAARAALGVRLAAYRFDRYRTREKVGKRPSVAAVQIISDVPDQAKAAYASLAALADAILFSRDLVSEPSNILYPAVFAERLKALEPLGLKVEILGEAEMQTLGMGALLGVGQGSSRESQLAVLQWSGAADPEAAPICFVGKGVCFDTGGISIKPSAGMEEMKTDMAGAAAVAGALSALAGRKAPINAVAVLGLVENMPDGAAQRPGDVVTSMSGQTIEVLDTDAEGRLVLADALWYAKTRFDPRVIVDLATLTGAVVIALGMDIAGLFSNDDDLAQRLMTVGQAQREPVWRLPMPDAYEAMIDSQIADVKNLAGRPASSITAALFLRRFVDGTAWAHLDIAATAWRKDSKDPTVPDGASGFGVRLLDALAATYQDAVPESEI